MFCESVVRHFCGLEDAKLLVRETMALNTITIKNSGMSRQT